MDLRNATIAPSLTEQWQSWRARQRAPSPDVTLTLPSGLTVRATRPNIVHLMQAGVIPDALAAKVQHLIALASGEGDGAVQADIDRELAADPAGFVVTWTKVLRIVWLNAVIDPRFSETPSDDEIPIDAVSEDDLTYLFVWAQGVDESVATFLDRRGTRQSAAVGRPSNGDDLRTGPGDSAGD